MFDFLCITLFVVMEQKQLPEDLFNKIKEVCPEFLQSYYVLARFYEHMTNDYTHKVWKDGRLVLTPIPKQNEGDNNSNAEAQGDN